MRTSTLWRPVIAAAAALTIWAEAAAAACGGDCSGNGSVAINELILGVNIALGTAPFSECPAFDGDASETVSIAELIAAVNNALGGCPATPTPPADTPTATTTATSPAATTATATSSAPATATATVSAPTATATAASTPVPTNTAETTVTATALATDTAVSTATVTVSAEATPTLTATSGASATATVAAVASATASDTPAGSPTDTTPPTASFTPTPSPTMGPSAECGNGFLEPGETCEGCAADCVVSPCTPTANMPSFAIHFTGVVGTIPTTVTVLLGYQSDLVSIPGASNELSVRQRITYPPPLPFPQSPNDLNYALRLVVGRTAGIPNGLLATVKLDQCQGALTAVPADFACTMEGCAGGGGAINGCTCTVMLP